MKLLLDSCVWGKAISELEDFGHEVTWVGDWEKDPGDEEILSIAYDEKAVLITIDSDFGTLAIVRGQPHSGIIRLVNLSVRQHAGISQLALEKYGDGLQKGAIVTAYADRFRVRLPD